MTETAQPQKEELKPHGDELASALKPTSAENENITEQHSADSGDDAKE